jgi:hypothetical protein
MHVLLHASELPAPAWISPIASGASFAQRHVPFARAVLTHRRIDHRLSTRGAAMMAASFQSSNTHPLTRCGEANGRRFS